MEFGGHFSVDSFGEQFWWIALIGIFWRTVLVDSFDGQFWWTILVDNLVDSVGG